MSSIYKYLLKNFSSKSLLTVILHNFCCVEVMVIKVNHLSANPTKWSNILKQFIGKLSTNYLSVFGHSVGLALKGLKLVLLKNNRIIKK